MIPGNRVKPSVALLFALLVVLAPAVRADQARDDRWRADLDFLASELPKRHVNLFFLMSQQQFDQAVNDLRQAIPNLSDTEVITGMARIVATAGDAHMMLSLPSAYFRSLPLKLYWFEDGLYVTGAAPECRRALADTNAGPASTATSGLVVLNGASFQPGVAVAPSALVSAFGDFRGVDSGDAGGIPLPTRIGGTQVLVNDVAAPLVAVRPTQFRGLWQINVRVPGDASLAGQAPVFVTSGTAASNPVTLWVEVPR